MNDEIDEEARFEGDNFFADAKVFDAVWIPETRDPLVARQARNRHRAISSTASKDNSLEVKVVPPISPALSAEQVRCNEIITESFNL